MEHKIEETECVQILLYRVYLPDSYDHLTSSHHKFNKQCNGSDVATTFLEEEEDRSKNKEY